MLVLAIASRHTAGSGFAGALLPSGVRAPAFHLRDQNGRQVSLDRELALARE